METKGDPLMFIIPWASRERGTDSEPLGLQKAPNVTSGAFVNPCWMSNVFEEKENTRGITLDLFATIEGDPATSLNRRNRGLSHGPENCASRHFFSTPSSTRGEVDRHSETEYILLVEGLVQ